MASAVFRTVLFEVIYGLLDNFNAVFEVTERKVAVGAKKSPYLTCGVTMIYIQGSHPTAAGTSMSLGFGHFGESVLGNAVNGFQVSVLSFVGVVLVVFPFVGG